MNDVPHSAPSEVDRELGLETEATAYRRDRLLASLALMMGAALLIALPFALRAGAEFFLPVTAALVIAVALVPAGRDRKSTRLNSSHATLSRMPSSA